MSVEPRLQVRFYRTEAGNEPVRLIKKSEKMPPQDLQLARQRLQSLAKN